MIQWNKGEPPKDGETYLVAMEEKIDSRRDRWVAEVEWFDNRHWLCFGRFICRKRSIVAWSEINLPGEKE